MSDAKGMIRDRHIQYILPHHTIKSFNKRISHFMILTSDPLNKYGNVATEVGEGSFAAKVLDPEFLQTGPTIRWIVEILLFGSLKVL